MFNNKKEKSKKKKKNNTILGGFLGDKDTRTKQSLGKMTMTLCFASLIVTGVVLLPVKYAEYNNFIINNTTPIGNEMTFKKTTNASLTLKEVWTDKERDLTVVRLGYNTDTTLTKSTAKAYGLHLVVNDKTVLPKDFKMSYGILGTDGDGYLFLKGKLQKQAYQVYIANRSKFRVPEEDVSDDNPQTNFYIDNKGNKSKGEDIQNEEKETITKMFSKQGLENADDEGHINDSGSEENPDAPDNIDFRVNPYSSTTKVYDGSFLNKDGSIDYEKVIEVINVKPNIKVNEEEIKKDKNKINDYEKSVEEYKQRLKINPDDTEAHDALSESQNKISELKKEILYSEKQIEALKVLKFNKKSFGIMQNEFDVQEIK